MRITEQLKTIYHKVLGNINKDVVAPLLQNDDKMQQFLMDRERYHRRLKLTRLFLDIKYTIVAFFKDPYLSAKQRRDI